MDESNSAACTESARNVVAALDSIFAYLMTVVLADEVEWDIPLTFSEVSAAKKIPPSGGITMHALAAAMRIPVASATHLVDRLVAKGVVTRIRPEYDRRLVLVDLTEKARACRDEVFRRRVALVERILNPFEPAAREQVVTVLGAIASSIPSSGANFLLQSDKRSLLA